MIFTFDHCQLTDKLVRFLLLPGKRSEPGTGALADTLYSGHLKIYKVTITVWKYREYFQCIVKFLQSKRLCLFNDQF